MQEIAHVLIIIKNGQDSAEKASKMSSSIPWSTCEPFLKCEIFSEGGQYTSVNSIWEAVVAGEVQNKHQITDTQWQLVKRSLVILVSKYFLNSQKCYSTVFYVTCLLKIENRQW